MSIGWKFPSNNYGTLNGIGEAGIETFRGTPYKSLAREICQNSLDAKRDTDKPVIVEFSCSQISVDELPDFHALKEAIEACLDFWTKQNNKKTIDFFKKAVAVSKQKTVPVLRISDFNTTGLVGSNQDYNTPWQNLVKASGVSDKGGNSGGSFGIGKSAPFVCSDLRTVFYATRDMNGLEAFQGIARLVSFAMKSKFLKRDTDNITTGIGYFGENDKNRAIPECQSLDGNFKRHDIGTDVFIIGFTNKPEWEREVITSVLDDFLISVYLGLLEVKVENTLISKKTLPKVIEEYKETAVMPYNYYQTLVSPAAHVINENFENLGEIELHILIQNGLHRRVMMSRSNGMKVFDQKNFPSAIQFAGICILKGEGANAYFREMENPQHDAWEPERHSKPIEAKKRKQNLFRYIKESILDFGRKTTVAEVDAEGVGEYLPDNVNPGPGDDKHETITDSTKSVEINMSSLKSFQKGFEVAISSKNIGIEDAEGVPEEYEYGDSGSKDFGDEGHNESKDGTGYGANPGDNPGTNGNGTNQYEIGSNGEPPRPLKKKFEINTMAVRLILLDASKNRYRLIFTPDKTAGDGYLQFKLSGEQSNIDVNVTEAINYNTGETLQTSKNIIYINNINAKIKMIVEFNVDYGERSSMEVSLYGYKI